MGLKPNAVSINLGLPSTQTSTDIRKTAPYVSYLHNLYGNSQSGVRRFYLRCSRVDMLFTGPFSVVKLQNGRHQDASQELVFDAHRTYAPILIDSRTLHPESKIHHKTHHPTTRD